MRSAGHHFHQTMIMAEGGFLSLCLYKVTGAYVVGFPKIGVDT